MLTYILVALALTALLVTLRLFLLKPRDKPPDHRSAFGDDARAALRELLSDPDSAAGREAEAAGDWPAAAAAYGRALEKVRDQDRDAPGRALKVRALQSKLEEIRRRVGGR